MSIKREGEKWRVDVYANGRAGKRICKKFDTKLEAACYEKYLLANISQLKDWNPSKPDSRKLSELILVWFKLSGIHLKDGERRKAKLIHLANALGDPTAKSLKANHFVAYRSERIAAGISPKTTNNELGYLNSLYNGLKSIGEIDYSNPLNGVKMIKLDERELSWLTSEQIKTLLETMDTFSLNPHVKIITNISLATGARWGEAEGLTLKKLHDGKLTFTHTKSGKNRSIPVSEELFEEIRTHLKNYGCFSSSINAFGRALKAAKILLPKGQSAHVLRHSFASHFVMNGGDILSLQKILGHSTIVMTMRYAHLSKDHLLDACKKNPIYGMS
jgi:site-specific recombinase XerD